MTRRRPALTLLAAAAFFGIAPTVSKYALGGFGPVTATLVELLAATAALWIVVLRRGCRPLLDRRRVLLLGLLEPGLAYLLFSFGLDLTTASNAALMTGLEGGFVVLLAALFLHERAGWTVVTAVLLGVLGLVVLEGGADLGAPGVGDLLMAAGSLSAALYTVVARGLAPVEDPLTVTAHQFTVATVVLVPLAVSRWSSGAEPLPAGVPLHFWLAAAVVGVVGFAAAFLLYNSAITRIQAGPAAVIINLSPAFGLASAVLWLGESLTVQRMIGAVLLTISVLVFLALEWSGQPLRARAAPLVRPTPPEASRHQSVSTDRGRSGRPRDR